MSDEQVSFDSRAPALKRIKSGKKTVTALWSDLVNYPTTVEIPHGLDFIPVYAGFYKASSTGNMVPINSGYKFNGTDLFNDNNDGITCSMYVDETNISFTVSNDETVGMEQEVDLYWILYQERLEASDNG